MGRTQVSAKQLLNGSLQREDMDITTPGNAMLVQVVAGDEIVLESTGGDEGTGVVTVAVSDAVKTHIAAAHAPSNAQKNEDITKSEIEAKLTGEVTSHSHAGLSLVLGGL